MTDKCALRVLNEERRRLQRHVVDYHTAHTLALDDLAQTKAQVHATRLDLDRSRRVLRKLKQTIADLEVSDD